MPVTPTPLAPTPAPPFGLWNIGQVTPEHVALITPDEEQVSAGELLAASNQVVHGLRALGLEPGDVVAMVLPNCREVFELYLAVSQAGFYLVPINWHLVGPEIAYIVSDSGAKALVAHARFADQASAAADEIDFPVGHRFAVGGDIPSFRAYDELKAGQPSSMPADRQAGMIMNYTSGTTGRPKGIRSPLPGLDPETAAGLYGGVLALFGVGPFDGNVHLVGSPMYHTAVMAFAIFSAHIGHTIVMMDKWTPEEMLRLVDTYRVTHTHMVPTQFVRLLRVPDDVKSTFDGASLRHVIHAAAPCAPAVKRQMIEWFGPVIEEYYGASEGGGTYVLAHEWLERPGTVGRPWPVSEIVILDDDGNELPPREVGTVYMYMNTGRDLFEYHGDQEKTEQSRRGKHFTVGDAGYLDEDGWLFLSDRKIDMIISGGANIYPAEVESELILHPEIADVAVFGIPNDEWGEEVKAVVEPVAGVTTGPDLEAEILEWCRARVAKYKTPASIDFTDSMPRDPNGKLYKRKLRDPYWVGRERTI